MTLSYSEKIICIIKRNDGDFYGLNCFHLFRTKDRLESHKRHMEIKIFVVL